MSTKEYLLSAGNWNPVLIMLGLGAIVIYMMQSSRRDFRRTTCFLAGVTILFVALGSPLNALSNGYLFSAHMLQHMLLLLVVPLLLLLGLPETKTKATHSRGRFHLPPLLGWVGGVSAMWIWHERTLCDLATSTETFRVAQIISLLGLGTCFWWPLFCPQIRRRITPLAGVIYLFSACIGCSVLGILITFAPAGAVCPIFLHPPNQPALLQMIHENWGLTAAKDQQIGGLLMWVPGCGIYLAGIMAMLARWYASSEEFVVAQSAQENGIEFSPAPLKVKES